MSAEGTGPGGREPGDDDLDAEFGREFDHDLSAEFDEEFQREFGPKPPRRAVVVVPVAAAHKVAELCTVVQVQGPVVPVRGLGCVLVPEPARAAADAETLSRALPSVELVLLTLGEEAVEGQTWRGGQRQEDPKPGLLLSVWPDTVQQLLFGRLDPASVAGTVTGGEGSRIGSFWKLFRGRKEP